MNDDIKSSKEIFDGARQIYRFHFVSHDLEKIYREILQDVSVDQVHEAFSDYVVGHIEPVGWRGLWLPSADNEYPEGTSFIVKATNVYANLEASVLILEQRNTTNPEHEFIPVEKVREVRVPLRELYVISDPDDQEQIYYETAALIEIVRIFFDNLWRPWDDLDDSYSMKEFFANRLLPRFKLMIDMRHEVVPDNVVNRIEIILNESKNLKKKMDGLKKNWTNDSNLPETNSGDEKDILDDMEALQYIKYKLKMEEYEREMKVIEDESLRPAYGLLISEPEDDDDGKIDLPCLHLVSLKGFSMETVAKLNDRLAVEQTQWPLKLHRSLDKALQSSKSGDHIFLTRGTYSQRVSWIEHDIVLNGIESGVELCSNKNCGDILLFLSVPNEVKICNMKIKAEHPLEHLIVAKSGHLILENCILDCNHQATNAVLALVDSKVTKNNTKIICNSFQER